MAELRSTDIINKLRKITDRISTLEHKVSGDIVEIASTGTMATTFVRNWNTNIRNDTGLQAYRIDINGGSEDDPYYIVYIPNDTNIHDRSIERAQAATYIGFMTGSKYVPVESEQVSGLPQYHYIISQEDKAAFLIRFCPNTTDSTKGELRLYKVFDFNKIEVVNEIEENSSDTVNPPSVKAIKDYVDSRVVVSNEGPTNEDNGVLWVKY